MPIDDVEKLGNGSNKQIKTCRTWHYDTITSDRTNMLLGSVVATLSQVEDRHRFIPGFEVYRIPQLVVRFEPITGIDQVGPSNVPASLRPQRVVPATDRESLHVVVEYEHGVDPIDLSIMSRYGTYRRYSIGEKVERVLVPHTLDDRVDVNDDKLVRYVETSRQDVPCCGLKYALSPTATSTSYRIYIEMVTSYVLNKV